jgi:micrococcal nuclease
VYQYRCRIVSVVDGDTVHADVDLGFDSHQLMTLRLADIDAPEISTPEGKAARAWLVDRVTELGMQVVITTIKDRKEKYGRYLAVLRSPVMASSEASINAAMVYAGHAVAYDGGKR